MNKNIRFFKAQKLHYGGFDAQWLSSEKMRRSRHRERADSRSTVIGCQKMKPEFYYGPIIMQQKEAALPIWNVIEFLLLCFGGANEFYVFFNLHRVKLLIRSARQRANRVNRRRFKHKGRDKLLIFKPKR